MTDHKNRRVELVWISLVTRLSVASLFFASFANKAQDGFHTIMPYYESVFKSCWLPLWMVRIHAWMNPFVEIIIPIWLVVGVRLRLGWIFTSFFMLSLAFGMAADRQHGPATHNYFYVLLCCTGLYLSRFDRLSWDGIRQKKP